MISPKLIRYFVGFIVFIIALTLVHSDDPVQPLDNSHSVSPSTPIPISTTATDKANTEGPVTLGPMAQALVIRFFYNICLLHSKR